MHRVARPPSAGEARTESCPGARIRETHRCPATSTAIGLPTPSVRPPAARAAAISVRFCKVSKFPLPSDTTLRVTQFIRTQGGLRVERECVFAILAQGGQSHGVPGRNASRRWRLENGKLGTTAFPGQPGICKPRIKDHGTGQTDHVDSAALYRVHCLVAPLEPARQHQGYSRHPFGTPGKVQKVRSSIRHPIGARLRSGKIGPATDVNQVDRCPVEKTRHLQCIVLRQSTFQLVRRVDLDSDGKRWTDCAPHLVYHPQYNLASCFDGTTVVIVAAVEQWRQELTQQETVSGVDMNAAKSRTLCKCRGSCVHAGQFPDFLDCHPRTSKTRHVERGRSLWHADRRMRKRTGMTELRPQVSTPDRGSPDQ